MANESNPRINTNVTVRQVGHPLTGDTALASGLQNLGSVGLQLNEERLANDLSADLLAEQDTFMKAVESGAFTKGEATAMHDFERRMGRLQAAEEQGTLGTTELKIRQEKILRDYMGRYPKLTPEFQRKASGVLGYNPIGSEIRELEARMKRAQSQEDEFMMLYVRQAAENGANLTDFVAGDFQKFMADASRGMALKSKADSARNEKIVRDNLKEKNSAADSGYLSLKIATDAPRFIEEARAIANGASKASLSTEAAAELGTRLNDYIAAYGEYKAELASSVNALDPSAALQHFTALDAVIETLTSDADVDTQLNRLKGLSQVLGNEAIMRGAADPKNGDAVRATLGMGIILRDVPEAVRFTNQMSVTGTYDSSFAAVAYGSNLDWEAPPVTNNEEKALEVARAVSQAVTENAGLEDGLRETHAKQTVGLIQVAGNSGLREMSGSTPKRLPQAIESIYLRTTSSPEFAALVASNPQEFVPMMANSWAEYSRNALQNEMAAFEDVAEIEDVLNGKYELDYEGDHAAGRVRLVRVQSEGNDSAPERERGAGANDQAQVRAFNDEWGERLAIWVVSYAHAHGHKNYKMAAKDLLNAQLARE